MPSRALTLCPHCGVLAGELHKDDCPTQWAIGLWMPPWTSFKPQDVPGSGRILSSEDSNLSESDTLLSRDDNTPEPRRQPTIMLGTDHEWEVPLVSQVQTYLVNVEAALDRLQSLLAPGTDYRKRIVELGLQRLVSGYAEYGSRIFNLTDAELTEESDEELGDWAVYESAKGGR